ncbi:MAG: MOSC domain-containing protein [Oleiphilaceae bacterium]|nr:MOSC domain-containing protein [Oleiphilaceae bacterium]
MATIAAIYTAEKSRGPVTARESVQARLGAGIVGDRHYRPRGTAPATQITLIAEEAVSAFNQAHGLSVPPGEFRRNLITCGVDLNALPGREFSVGAVRLRGIEPCDPCSVLGRILQQPDLTPPQVVKALMGQGGLRAEVLSTGVIRVGDAVVTGDADAVGGTDHGR